MSTMSSCRRGLSSYEAVTVMTKMLRLMGANVKRFVTRGADPTEVVIYEHDIKCIRGWLLPDNNNRERHETPGHVAVRIEDTLMIYLVHIVFVPDDCTTAEPVLDSAIDSQGEWSYGDQTPKDAIVRRFLTADDGSEFLRALSGRRYY